MSKPNVASVLLAIYASKQIANCKVPQLRYAPKSMNGNAQHSRVCDRPWAQRALQSIRFVLSVIGIKEVAVILSILSALICRSLLRLKLLTLSTEVENSVMKGSERSFWKSIETFAFYVIPTSASYAVFNYLLSELAIRVRSSVSTRLLGKFTASKVYFQVINATQLQSIAQEANPVVSAPNPDQILTNDIEHFSYALSGLFSHVMRPVVDILVNAERLYTTGGAVVPLVMGLYLVVTSNLLNYIRAPVGSFTDREQSLEGEYRSLVARIATSAEEIAALEGGKNEEANVLQSLHPLLEYSRKFAQFRCNMSFIDAVVARYWLMMLGWRIVGLHFFRANRSRPSSSSDNDSHTSSDEVCSNDDNSCDNSDSSLPGDTTKHAKEDAEADQQGEEFLFRDYQNMSKTMLALSNAVGELIMSGRDVVKVFAYAEKLSAFEEALDELLRRDAAHKEANSVTSGAETRSWEDTLATSTRIKSADDLQAPEIVRAAGSASKGPSFAPTLAAAPSESIVLEEVSIVPPSGGAPLHTGMNIVFRR